MIVYFEYKKVKLKPWALPRPAKGQRPLDPICKKMVYRFINLWIKKIS